MQASELSKFQIETHRFLPTFSEDTVFVIRVLSFAQATGVLPRGERFESVGEESKGREGREGARCCAATSAAFERAS